MEKNKQADKNKLFVGNLSWKTTPEQLKAHFETIGEVTNTKIVTDAATGRSKGFGFVEMGSAALADSAIRELNDKPLLDRNLRISLAEERKERPERREPRRSYDSAYQSRSHYRGHDRS